MTLKSMKNLVELYAKILRSTSEDLIHSWQKHSQNGVKIDGICWKYRHFGPQISVWHLCDRLLHHRPDAHHKRTFVPSHRLCPIIDAMSRAFIKGAKNAIKVTDHAWEFAMALHVGILPSFIFYMHPLFMRKFFAILLENQYSEEAQISQEILISLFEN